MAETVKDGGPAFAHGNPTMGGDPGMSLRDYFAGQVLGALAGYGDESDSGKELAQFAYEMADRMLREREK